MADDRSHIEEHELPSTEAMLACTLVLMTGYSQALQAEVHPRQRLAMGEKITSNLLLLVEHPMLSIGFRQVLLGLQVRWREMAACTLDAAHDCTGAQGPSPQAHGEDDGFERHPVARRRLH